MLIVDLLDILQDESQPLEKRLKVALCKFLAIDNSTTKNRETVIQWMKNELLDRNKDSEERKLLFIHLSVFIPSLTEVYLNPQLADSVLDVSTIELFVS